MTDSHETSAASAVGDHPPRFARLVRKGSSRAASRRLTASVETFEADLNYRLDSDQALRKLPAAKAIKSRLKTVRKYHQDGEIETAWRCFTSATRLELQLLNETELLTRAQALRQEAGADKLSSAWRSKAIQDLLDSTKIEDQLPSKIDDVRLRLSLATFIRDEDADNRYYKVALVRDQRSLLLLVLIACILVLLGLAASVDWHGDLADPSVGFVALVAVFGGMGACLSAIRSLGQVGGTARIPEHVASSSITITRPALGAAAALGVYAIAASGILNIALEDEEAHLTVLALAFAAGFSEQLVLKAVGAATGSVGQKENR